MTMTKHTFKDFATGKMRFTRGQFVGWTPPGGLLGVPYAAFKTSHGLVFVPRYVCTRETLAEIGEPGP